MKKKELEKAAQNLLSEQPAGGWVGWLFDMQNALIFHGHLEAFTEKGSKEFAGHFSSLKSFFEDIGEGK